MLNGCTHPSPQPTNLISNEIPIHSGDLAFRLGSGTLSKSVVKADTSSTFSHVGMIIHYHNQWCVIHAVPNERKSHREKDSVKIEPLTLFFSSERAVHGAIYHAGATDEDTLKLLQKALSIYQRHILFDNAFDCEDSSKFYCTELVWYLYLSTLNKDLSCGKRHKVPALPPVIFCSDILSYPDLKEIYHF